MVEKEKSLKTFDLDEIEEVIEKFRELGLNKDRRNYKFFNVRDLRHPGGKIGSGYNNA